MKPDRQARDQRIRRLREAGWTWRKIAAEVGLSVRRAQQVLQRDADAVSAADQQYVEAVRLRELIVRANP